MQWYHGIVRLLKTFKQELRNVTYVGICTYTEYVDSSNHDWKFKFPKT